MKTLLFQINDLYSSKSINNRTFYIDTMESHKELEGCKCKFISIQDGNVKFVNCVDDEIESISENTICIISAN